LSGSYRTATGFCIEKRIWRQETWKTLLQNCEVVSSLYTFRVPEHRLEDYFEHSPGLAVSGAIAVEDYGLQFLEKIEGSYSTIVGLPLYEVRTTLEEFGFFTI
jgi:septum formation protein